MGLGTGEKGVSIEEVWSKTCYSLLHSVSGRVENTLLSSPLLLSRLVSSPLLCCLEHSVHFSSCCCLGCLVSSWQVKGSCVQRFNTLTQRKTHTQTHTLTCCQCMQEKQKSCNDVLCSLLILFLVNETVSIPQP